MYPEVVCARPQSAKFWALYIKSTDDMEEKVSRRMVKGEYKQLHLHRQFGGIYAIVYTQTLCAIKRKTI